jgi:alpha-tubulin suppressor-like RCC1 family protein
MPPGVGNQIADVAAGGGHTCTLAAQGGTYCSGWGGYGILGNGSETSSATPTPIAGTHSFVSLSAGISHTCGLTITGASWCWGFGWYGELGTNGNLDPQSFYAAFSATAVFTSQLFSQLVLGGNYSCGLRAVGDALCWGENRFGQVGAAATNTCANFIPCNPNPAPAAAWRAFRTLSLGRARLWDVSGFGSSVHTCGTDFSDRGYCWGSNDAGQLGVGAIFATSRGPQAIQLPARAHPLVKSFANGYRHTCLLSLTNQIWCVGENAEGQLANGNTAPFSTTFNRVTHP